MEEPYCLVFLPFNIVALLNVKYEINSPHPTKLITDVDECNALGVNNCSSNADCVNEPGSFRCNCEPGYSGDGVKCTGELHIRPD